MKVLLLDIETAPKKAYVWGVWKANIGANQLMNDWFMLTWSAKWLGEKEVFGQRLMPDEVIQEDDKEICEGLWKLLDEADVVIGHNGDKFDIPCINTRFISNGITPPSPYHQIDTLKIAKKFFNFTYNRLDYLGDFLGVGRKIDTGGFELWSRCMDGESLALEEMLDYNKQDVVLLEDVYMKLRPFDKHTPSYGVHEDGKMVCTHCGGTHLQSRGTYTTKVSKFHRYWCTDCGGWSRSRYNIRDKHAMKNTLMPV